MVAAGPDVRPWCGERRPHSSPFSLELLGALAKTDAEISEQSRLVEIYTMEGLLQVGGGASQGAKDVVIMCGGAMGGVTDQGTPCMSNCGVDGRRRSGRDGGRLPQSRRSEPVLLDTCAAVDLAMRNGAERFVVLGHFGGVAVQAAGTFPHLVAGVITHATQSAGCEEAARMGDTPLLLLHGEQRLDPRAGELDDGARPCRARRGVRTFPNADHLMSEVADEIVEITGEWCGPASTNTQGANGLSPSPSSESRSSCRPASTSQPGGGIAAAQQQHGLLALSAPPLREASPESVGSARFRGRRRSPSSQRTRTHVRFSRSNRAPCATMQA